MVCVYVCVCVCVCVCVRVCVVCVCACVRPVSDDLQILRQLFIRDVLVRIKPTHGHLKDSTLCEHYCEHTPSIKLSSKFHSMVVHVYKVSRL